MSESRRRPALGLDCAHRHRVVDLRAPADALSPDRADEVDEAGVVAERIVVLVVLILRAGTVGLGLVESAGSSSFTHPAIEVTLLAGLAVESAVMALQAAWRLRRGSIPALDSWTMLIETAAGIAALLVMAYATPVDLRATSSFWVEQYTVVTAITLGASAARRPVQGAVATLGLTVAYLVSQLAWAAPGAALSTPARATAWTNSVSYLPFFVISAVGFALVRAIVRQTEVLRRVFTQLSAERARVVAAGNAYRVGHDIPKALLREVRRGSMSAEQLRPWAMTYRDDLLAALRGGDRPEVTLGEELTSLTSAFMAAMKLEVEMAGVGEVPPKAPTLLIVEAVRELLNNASYHAYGYAVTLRATSSRSAVTVDVHNGGPGVDSTMLASSWARKQNTLHQFEAAGGSYQIASAPDSVEGTTITLTWPGVAGENSERGRIAPVGP